MNHPDKWSLINFPETYDLISANGIKIKQKEYLTSGSLPIVDQGQELIGGYTNDVSKRIEGEPPFIIFGDHTKAVKFLNFSFAPGADGIKILKPKKFIDATLFSYFLTILTKKIPDKGYARHYQHLCKETFPLPPLPEQHRIVAKIEELFSDLDAGIASLRKAKEQLKIYRQSVLKWAFEGKLTEEWRKKRLNCDSGDSCDEDDLKNQGNHKNHKNHSSDNGLESAAELLKRIRAEREKKYKEECEKAKKEGKKAPKKLEELPPISDEELEGLPKLAEGWKYVRLASVTEIKGGITKDSKRIEKGQREVPYLRVANVQRGYIDLSEVKTILATQADIDELRLCKNDILFNEGGDRDKLGRGWVWNNELPLCIHQNHVFRARLQSPEIESRLVSYFGNTYGQKYFLDEGKQTTNLASINMTKLSQFPIPLAPFSEQKEVLQEIESRLSVADNLEKTIDSSLTQADALRQSILKRAFEGKLVPQDPKDEPASELLKRIMQEKTTKDIPKKGRRGK